MSLCKDCRGGTPWPPLVEIVIPPKGEVSEEGVATECHPYNSYYSPNIKLISLFIGLMNSERFTPRAGSNLGPGKATN
jgi:hypothetical protein